jgi:hypothetical protein
MNDGFGVASAGIDAAGPSCSANSGQDRTDPRTLIWCAQVREFRLRRLVPAQIRRQAGGFDLTHVTPITYPSGILHRCACTTCSGSNVPDRADQHAGNVDEAHKRKGWVAAAGPILCILRGCLLRERSRRRRSLRSAKGSRRSPGPAGCRYAHCCEAAG